MNTHNYSEPKTDHTTGREWHQCGQCGQVAPVDNNSMHNRLCFASAEQEQKRAESLFTSNPPNRSRT